uniref:Uncharacterized protein n=1 Tax=Oryza glumipatula TaxID=40148 RepID=A0A0E0A6E1_9ORYZ
MTTKGVTITKIILWLWKSAMAIAVGAAAAASAFFALRKNKVTTVAPMMVAVATQTGTVAGGFLKAKARRRCAGAMVPRAGAVTAAMTKTTTRMSTRGLRPANPSKSLSASGPPSAPAPMATTMVFRRIAAMGDGAQQLRTLSPSVLTQAQLPIDLLRGSALLAVAEPLDRLNL